MSSIKDVAILSRSSTNDLEALILSHLKRGYIMQGNLNVAGGSPYMWYTQVMVKYEEE